jgi:hypothetical protein
VAWIQLQSWNVLDGALLFGHIKPRKKCILPGPPCQAASLTIGRLYNEAMGKNLADKYSHLSSELDKIVHEANSELRKLENKVKGTIIARSG